MLQQVVNIDGLLVGPKYPVRVMGVVNLSRESFYKGSVIDTDEELEQAVRRMEKQGAQIIDVGGSSTAPKSVYTREDVSLREEMKRVLNAVKVIKEVTNLPISVDTTSARVAEAALDSGASVVNDVSGLQDPHMTKVISDRGVPVIVMACCEPPCSTVHSSLESLKIALKRCDDAEVDLSNIIFDPGIGFGKPTEIDFAILRNLDRYKSFGQPLLVGVSRKAFIGDCLGEPDPSNRLAGTIAATAIAVFNGADIVRAHDVAEAVAATRIAESGRSSTISHENIELLGKADECGIEIVLEKIGTGSSIREPLARKAVVLNLFISGLEVPQALIIKQEMLALDGDAAYHYDTIDFDVNTTDLLVMGTILSIGRLVDKLSKMNYFGLPRIAEAIRRVLDERKKESAL